MKLIDVVAMVGGCESQLEAEWELREAGIDPNQEIEQASEPLVYEEADEQGLLDHGVSARARAIGEEFAETEEQMQAINESLANTEDHDA